MLAFGCNTVFTFYTLYLFLCPAFFFFDWQIAIISSRMVVPTQRHRIAIRLAWGIHLSSAVQADVSTCSGVVRLLLLSLQLRKPSGIGLRWVVGREFLSLSVPCDPLMSPLVHSLFMLDWSVKFSALYFWIVLDDLMSSTTSYYQIRSTGFLWKIYWLLGILGAFGYPRCCAVLRLLGGLSVFLVLGNLWETWCMGIRLCCFCDFYLWVGSVIRNRRLILGLCGW